MRIDQVEFSGDAGQGALGGAVEKIGREAGTDLGNHRIAGMVNLQPMPGLLGGHGSVGGIAAKCRIAEREPGHRS